MDSQQNFSFSRVGGWYLGPQNIWLLAGLVHLLGGEPNEAVAAEDLLLEEVGVVVATEGSLLDGDGVVLGQLHTFLNVATV